MAQEPYFQGYGSRRHLFRIGRYFHKLHSYDVSRYVQQRNAVDGPYYVEDRVYSNSSERYSCKFWSNQLAEVAIVGDGDTDLDLYIYDSNGNLITKDDSTSGNAYCSWIPAWTDTFVIKVVNRGSVYNDFILVTN